MARRTLLVTYAATYLVAVGNVIRYLVSFRDDSDWSITLLLGGYLILLFSESILFRRNRLLTYIYFLAQVAIVSTLSRVAPGVDYWAALTFPLVVQVMHIFPRRTGFVITGIFATITSVLLLLGLGLEVGLPLVLIFGAVNFLLAAFIAIIREAEAAREESQKQQAELQQEVEQRAQVEEALRKSEMEKAVAAERSRLARELHDSVTQSLYSLTLLAEAGQRMIQAEELQQIAGNQARLGEIAQQALQEMRLLVYELRPLALEREGLIGALEQRLETVERRAGIQARVLVVGDTRTGDTDTRQGEGQVKLAPDLEEELYGIAQEALNNALKHANASRVVSSVHVTDESVALEVADDGQGLDPRDIHDTGGLGLVSMQERAEKIGGELTIDSAPGEGTRVMVTVPLTGRECSPSQSVGSSNHPEASDG
jgi:signal transduction histidine kinase